MLYRQLPRIFCLNTRKGFASNPQFLLLTLKLPSVRTNRSFVAHMFTSCHCVADVVPPERREGEHCQAPSPIRHNALSHKALVNDIVRYKSLKRHNQGWCVLIAESVK
jgi:hypothetical protein